MRHLLSRTTPKGALKGFESLLFAALIWGGATVFAQASVEATEVRHADVDFVDVSVGQALRLAAELYDLSIVSGTLPEHKVSLRLRAVTAEDLLGALEAVAGLTIEARGEVFFVRANSTAERARQIVRHPDAEDAATLDWLRASGVEARRLQGESLLLEGTAAALETATVALEEARDAALAQEIYALGAAPGEETLAAIQPLLDESFETVTYNATGHQLAVSALPGTHYKVSDLLDELTQPPAQFEIEVRLVEVSTRALERMGSQGFFRLEVRGGLLPTTFPLAGLDGQKRYLPSPNDLADLGNIGGGGAGGIASPGSLGDSGFRFGQIDGRGIGFLIEFLEQSGDAKVVATPKVTTLDNRQARISMVTTLRIPTFTQNQAFATTTVSGIETVDVGTVLEVRPRKSIDRQIVLTVTPEVSELEPTEETFSQNGLTQGLPVVTRRRTETEVIMEAGETLVIGGLVRERLANTLGKTPGLGDIPVIGRAFQHKGQRSENTELLVFVTPRELPPAEQRHAKTRVDDQWIPNALAHRLEEARAAVAKPHSVQRLAGLGSLSRLDGELRLAGVDLGPEIARLYDDRDLNVRVAAALFFLHHRPAVALFELTRFVGNREVALGVLARPLAPHLRVAIGELIRRSDGGVEALSDRFRRLAAAGRGQEAGLLLDTLSAVAPLEAASLASASGARTGIPQRLHLEALGGSSASTEALAALVDGALSMEHRAVALAALARSRSVEPGITGVPRHGGAEEVEVSPWGTGEADVLRVRDASEALGAFLASSPEPALGWTGEPGRVRVIGGPKEVTAIEEALELLGRHAPDLGHLVGFALASLEAGSSGPLVDPASRHAVVNTDQSPQLLAHGLVRLASLVFETRVRGYAATSERSLARAVRLEIEAMERLIGAPCPPEHAEATVSRVLLNAALEGESHG